VKRLPFRWFELLVVAILGIIAIAFSMWLVHLADYAIPRRNIYFNADTDRVFANLIDRNSNHLRLTVHPLFGMVCIAFQKIFGMNGDLRMELLAWSVAQGLSLALGIYLAVRLYGGGIAAGVAAVLLGLSSGAFLYWGAITETHVLGGISVLVIAILWRWRFETLEMRLLQSAIMFTLGASLVITNVAAWGLAQLRLRAAWTRDWWGLVRDNLGAALFVITGGLAGLGLLTAMAAIQDHILRNDSVPPLLRLWFEQRFVALDRGGLMDLVNAVGLAGPDTGLWVFVNLLSIPLILWALVRNGPDRAFLALWPLFGLLLHSVYDRAHAFLFSPNYTPLAIVAIAIALDKALPRVGWALMLASATMLCAVNLPAYIARQAAISAETDPPEWYAGLRAPHPVPESNIVRLADQPIGYDQ
jgi:hypothetical protein